MADTKRRDNKGRVLRTGESQRKDGRYMYRWTLNGKEKTIYALSLAELREKELQVQNDIADGIDGQRANNITLNDMFEKYIASKTELKQSTRTNYTYMYKNYVADTLGKKKIGKIKYSDIKSFYNSLIREKNFKPNSMEIINTILHQRVQTKSLHPFSLCTQFRRQIQNIIVILTLYIERRHNFALYKFFTR